MYYLLFQGTQIDMNSHSDTQKHRPMLKPIEEINKLFRVFQTESSPVEAGSVDRVFSFQKEGGEMQVILVTEGSITVYRKTDKLRFAKAAAPSIFGMQGSPFRYDLYEFKYDKTAKLESLPLSRAIALITEHHLLQEMLTYQIYFNDHQAYRDNSLIGKSAYEMICSLLLELQEFPKEERNTQSVYNYIYEHTHLARSGVMKILADLRKGEYIILERGKLIDIIKPFPKEY